MGVNLSNTCHSVAIRRYITFIQTTYKLKNQSIHQSTNKKTALLKKCSTTNKNCVIFKAIKESSLMQREMADSFELTSI